MASTPEEEDEEQREGMFSAFTFCLDPDVQVRAIIKSEGGTIVSQLPSSFDDKFIWIVNQACVLKEEEALKPKGCRVVFQNWVNMCILHRGIVDEEPFTVSEPVAVTKRRRQKEETENAQSAAPKRTKPDPYSKDEDNALLAFASEHVHDLLTQEALWEKAERKHLLPKRTAVSMMKRYSQLRRTTTNVTDKSRTHFDPVHDLALLKWAWCWHHMTPKDKGLKIWEAAQQNDVVFFRKATQMEARYRRVLERLGGFKKAMEQFKNGVDDERWVSFFTPKPMSDLPPEGSNWGKSHD